MKFSADLSLKSTRIRMIYYYKFFLVISHSVVIRTNMVVQNSYVYTLYVASDQGLHCLPFILQFLDTSQSSQMAFIKF